MRAQILLLSSLLAIGAALDAAAESSGKNRHETELSPVTLTDLAAKAEFRVFKGVADGGGRVRGINAKGAAGNYSRKDIDQLTEYVQQDFAAKGMALAGLDLLTKPELLAQAKADFVKAKGEHIYVNPLPEGAMPR